MIPQGECATGIDDCCVSLYDIAFYLLTEAYTARMACYPKPECCDVLKAYVTMGRATDGVADAVTVVQRSINPKTGNVVGPNVRTAVFDVILRESGWPIATWDGQSIILPEPKKQAEAAKHMFAGAEAIDRRLTALATAGALVPQGIRCTKGLVGQMVPLDPSGGVAGFSWAVNVDLPWN